MLFLSDVKSFSSVADAMCLMLIFRNNFSSGH